MKWGRDEMGGDFSEDLIRKGWSDQTFGGCELLITIKRGLVPDDSIYGFADPKFIGKSFELQPPTMYVKREAYLMEFFLWETLGGGIGHTAGLQRVDFA
jgi:hypothetical protein